MFVLLLIHSICAWSAHCMHNERLLAQECIILLYQRRNILYFAYSAGTNSLFCSNGGAVLGHPNDSALEVAWDSLTIKHGDKDILKSVSGNVKGRFLAIMGGSGSGKVSLFVFCYPATYKERSNSNNATTNSDYEPTTNNNNKTPTQTHNFATPELTRNLIICCRPHC